MYDHLYPHVSNGVPGLLQACAAVQAGRNGYQIFLPPQFALARNRVDRMFLRSEEYYWALFRRIPYGEGAGYLYISGKGICLMGLPKSYLT